MSGLFLLLSEFNFHPMATHEELRELASQLRQPSGTKGIEIADMMHETNISMTLHSIEYLNLNGKETILEIGHGNGGHIKQLLQNKPHLVYHGLEVSELMHEEAKRGNEDFICMQQAFFHLYEGSHIPFDAHSFDKIFTVNTLYFWKEPQVFLNELNRVLRPEGQLNITFAQKSFMEQLPFTQFLFELYDTDRVEKLIAESPFKIKDIEHQTENIKSKTGDWVERTFTTAMLVKK